MRVFKGRQWPQVALDDADLLGRLIDEFLRSPADIWPSIRELIELSGSQPSNPDRPIWLWLAAWSSATDELDEPLLALKIAAFTLAWRDRSTARRVAALLHPLDPTSNEFAQIQQSAVAAARQVSNGPVFRDVGELTTTRLTTYLYGRNLRSAIGHGSQSPPIDRRYAGLGTDRVSLLEWRCSNQWATFLELLEPDEQVRAASPVLSFNIRTAVLGLTDSRVVIVAAGKFFLGGATYVEVDLADVLTVRYNHSSPHAAAMEGGFKDAFRSLRQLVIESRTGDCSVSFGVRGTPKNEGAEWPTLILRQKRASLETPILPPSPRPAAIPDLPGQLEKLGQLKQDGILTEAEFAAAKARLLG